jgi:hypothetical protein
MNVIIIAKLQVKISLNLIIHLLYNLDRNSLGVEKVYG